MDQLEGLAPMHEDWGVNLGEEIDDGGDPPRIWAADGRYPGTAFTRSIGDHIAEGLGVFATPEILTFELDNTHEFIVVASDGVWEFIASDEACRIVEKHKNATEACSALVVEAAVRWKRYEGAYRDDITAIVAFLPFLGI